MLLLLHIYLAILAIAASHAHAVPAALSRHEQYVPSMAAGNSPEPISHHDNKQRGSSSSSPHYALKLPGVNHKPVPPTMLSGAHANVTTGVVTNKPTAVFGPRCRQLTLLGDGKRGQSTLLAVCLDDAMGTWWLTSLNLNQCLGNAGGKLVFQARGNYDATCRPCGIETTGAVTDGQVLLRCACLRKADGVSTFAELSLTQDYGDVGIKVVDGRLVCGSHKGTKSPSFSG